MNFNEVITNWLGVLGGISGLFLLFYGSWMMYHARKKNQNIELVLRDTAEIKGMLRGRK